MSDKKYHPETKFGRDGMMICACGYDGRDGWDPAQVDEEEFTGHQIDAWFCPKCEAEVCRCGQDCPPDEFGQVCE